MTLHVDVQLTRGDLDLSYAFSTSTPITGVFGASGAGKTSLLHLVAGLVRPTSGSVRLEDDVLFDHAARVDTPVHRRRIGMVFQDDRLFPHRSVRSNLRYGYRGDHAGPGVDEITRVLELEDLLGRSTGTLSGGERQRVALGRAVLAAPRLLLLDEPVSSLDATHRARILRLIGRIRDRFAIRMLYVTHDLTELLQLTDRLLLIDSGRVIGHGSLRELAGSTRAWVRMQQLGPVNVLRARVVDHDPGSGLTRLRLAGEGDAVHVVAPLTDQPPGAEVALSIRPDDIAIAWDVIDRVSIRNQIPARVVAVTTHSDRSIVEVDIGAPLLVEVSHQTVHELDLTPDRQVRCLIKSNAVRCLPDSGPSPILAESSPPP